MAEPRRCPGRWNRRAYESDTGCGATARSADAADLRRALDGGQSSAAIWLEDIDTRRHHLDDEHISGGPRAAGTIRRQCRGAGRRRAARASGSVARTVREYADGRVASQVIPHCAVTSCGHTHWSRRHFGPDLRAGSCSWSTPYPALLDELDALPAGVCHGDACTRNLLMSRSNHDLVMIDFGFLRYAPLGIDLSQLILGEIQLGERDPGPVGGDQRGDAGGLRRRPATGGQLPRRSIRWAGRTRSAMAIFSGRQRHPVRTARRAADRPGAADLRGQSSGGRLHPGPGRLLKRSPRRRMRRAEGGTLQRPAAPFSRSTDLTPAAADSLSGRRGRARLRAGSGARTRRSARRPCRRHRSRRRHRRPAGRRPTRPRPASGRRARRDRRRPSPPAPRGRRGRRCARSLSSR